MTGRTVLARRPFEHPTVAGRMKKHSPSKQGELGTMNQLLTTLAGTWLMITSPKVRDERGGNGGGI